MAFVSRQLLRPAQRPCYLASHASSPAIPHIMARGSTGPITSLRRYFQLVSLVTRLASQVCCVMLLRFHPWPCSGMVSLTSRSRGTAIVPMSVPLTQALGAHIFFGSSSRSRNFSRRSAGIVAPLALRKLGRPFHGSGIRLCPESVPQPACRPPPTSLATSRQR